MIGDPPELSAGIGPVEWLRQCAAIDRRKGAAHRAGEAEAIADWLERGLEHEKANACPPDHENLRRFSNRSEHEFGDVACGWPGRSTGPMPLWEPSEILPGRWQAIREVNDGVMSQRFFDHAAVENDYGMKERKAMIYESRRACESRCFELNRRRCIGGDNPPAIGRSMSQWPSPSDRHEPER